MRKIIVIVLALSALLICSLPVYADSPQDVQVLQLPYEQPQVGYYQSSSLYNYAFLMGQYDKNSGLYYLRYGVVSSPNSFNVTGFTPALYPYRIPTIYIDNYTDVTYTLYYLSIVDGHVEGTYTYYPSAAFLISAPVGDGLVSYGSGLYFYDDGVNTFPVSSYVGYGSTYGGYATDYHFITFTEVPISQSYVRSILPEPVCDDYNRYVVLTGENESHLLCLNYQFEFLYGVTSGAQQTVEYDIRQADYYAPTFRKTDTGYGLRVQMDPVMYIYLQNLNFSGMVSISWYVYDYNLISGEFVNMISGVISDVQADIYYTIIADNLQFNAVGICTYGVNYDDLSSSDHLHRASVLYGVDPDFETWRSEISNWLEQIYNVVSATEMADDVTIENDTAAASELHQIIDDLQPTNEQGSKVNTADVVSQQFSDAAEYMSDVGSDAGEFNEYINDFVWLSPLYYVPLIVALALGLLITILGKNKSD